MYVNLDRAADWGQERKKICDAYEMKLSMAGMEIKRFSIENEKFKKMLNDAINWDLHKIYPTNPTLDRADPNTGRGNTDCKI